MLTLDMPLGFSSKVKLTRDSSLLHQHVLKALPNVPAGSAPVLRRLLVLAPTLRCVWPILEAPRLKAVWLAWGRWSMRYLAIRNDRLMVPEMYLDVLASRLHA